MSAERPTLGQVIAQAKSGIDAKNIYGAVGDVVAQDLAASDSPETGGLFDLLGSLKSFVSGGVRIPQRVESRVGELLGDAFDMTSAMKMVRTQLEQEQLPAADRASDFKPLSEIFSSEFDLSDKGSVDSAAQWIAGLRAITRFRSGTGSTQVGAESDGETMSQLDVLKSSFENAMKQAREDAKAQMDLMKEEMDKQGRQTQEVMRSMMSGGGGGEGLAMNDPAYELQIFNLAMNRVYLEMAGINRQSQDWEERVNLIRETVVWFVSNDMLRRYLPSLLSKAGNSFEVATAVGDMLQGMQKAQQMWEKLMMTKNGNLEEIGGVGAEAPNSTEFEALLHNTHVDMRLLTKEGKEVTVRYGMKEMWDYFLGNYGEAMQLGEMEHRDVVRILRRYNDLLKARYGDDFNAVRALGKYRRIQDYRRDLSFVRNDVDPDRNFEKHWRDINAERFNVGWYDAYLESRVLDDDELGQFITVVNEQYPGFELMRRLNKEGAFVMSVEDREVLLSLLEKQNDGVSSRARMFERLENSSVNIANLVWELNESYPGFSELVERLENGESYVLSADEHKRYGDALSVVESTRDYRKLFLTLQQESESDSLSSRISEVYGEFESYEEEVKFGEIYALYVEAGNDVNKLLELLAEDEHKDLIEVLSQETDETELQERINEVLDGFSAYVSKRESGYVFDVSEEQREVLENIYSLYLQSGKNVEKLQKLLTKEVIDIARGSILGSEYVEHAKVFATLANGGTIDRKDKSGLSILKNLFVPFRRQFEVFSKLNSGREAYEVGRDLSLTEEDRQLLVDLYDAHVGDYTEEKGHKDNRLHPDRTRVRRGEKLTTLEQQFVREILEQDVFVSSDEEYKVSHVFDDGAVLDGGMVGRGEEILLWFLNGDEQEKIQLDTSAVPIYHETEDPAEGPLMPAWELFSQHLSHTNDEGAIRFILHTLKRKGLSREDVVAVNLPRRKDGTTVQYAIEVNGRRGAVSRYEVGNLSGGDIAELGEGEAFAVQYKILRKPDGSYLYDQVGDLVLAPKKDANGDPMYEPERDKRTGKIVYDEDGGVVYALRRDRAGHIIRDHRGIALLQPKLDDKKREQYEPVLDDKGEVQYVSPSQFLVHNVMASRLAPIFGTMKGLWNLCTLTDGDPVNAGQYTPKGILKSIAYMLYGTDYNIINPYAADFFIGSMDDLFHRNRSKHAMIAGKSQAARKIAVRALDPLRLKSKEEIMLEPYVANESQTAMLDRLLQRRSEFPMSVNFEYRRMNKINMLAEKFWNEAIQEHMPGMTIDGVYAEVIAAFEANPQLSRDLHLLSKSRRKMSDSERGRLAELEKRIAREMQSKFEPATISAQQKLLRVAKRYQQEDADSGFGLKSPVGRVRSRREILREILGWMSPGQAEKLGFPKTDSESMKMLGFDAYEHLDSLGIDVESRPRFASRGRLATLKWAEQMSVGLHDMGDKRDLFTAHFEYVGKEGTLMQQVYLPFISQVLIRASGEGLFAQFGMSEHKPRDFADLVFSFQDLMKTGGLKQQDVRKYAEEQVESQATGRSKMSYRNSPEQSKFVLNRHLFSGDLMFPTMRSTRFVLMRNNKELPESKTIKLHRRRFLGMKSDVEEIEMAETGKPGDSRKMIEVDLPMHGVGPGHVLRNVVEKTGIGVVYSPAENRGKSYLLNSAFHRMYQIHGSIGANNELRLRPLMADPLAIYTHIGPKLVNDPDGTKMQEAKEQFMTAVGHRLMDKAGYTVDELRELMELV